MKNKKLKGTRVPKNGRGRQAHLGSGELMGLARISADHNTFRAEMSIVKTKLDEFDEYRRAETGFLTDLMFSLGGLSKALCDSVQLRMVEERLKEMPDDKVLTVADLKSLFVTLPLLSEPQVISAKAKVRTDYVNARKPFRELTYKGETKIAKDWAEFLMIDYQAFEELFTEHRSIDKVIEALGYDGEAYASLSGLSKQEETVVEQLVEETVANLQQSQATNAGAPA